MCEQNGCTDQNRRTANVNKEELDEETAEKLRGDTIGDTLYSQSFVLKTLLQLSDLEWTAQVEEDLCFLWDMTVEPQVCEYLFNLSFPAVACAAIIKYDNNRFVEIIVGILANIICSDCEKTISEDEINIVLNFLDTDDSLILIQVCRFVCAVVYIKERATFVTENVVEKLTFIASNSVNKELILKTLEALSKLTVDFKLDENLVKCDMLRCALVGCETVFGECGLDLDIAENRSATKFLLEICTNICAYIDKNSDRNLLSDIQQYSDAFVENCVNVLDFYSRNENLFPVNDDFSFYVSAMLYILKTLNVGYVSDFFRLVHKILHLLLDCKDECPDVFKNVLELEAFQIYKAQGDIFCNIFQKYHRKNTLEIYDCLKESTEEFDFDISDQLEHIKKLSTS